MNEKKYISKKYKKKIEVLKKHNNLYYNQDNPEISDKEYDVLKQELQELEKKYKFLTKLNLQKDLVGATPTNKFKKIKHLFPMLSLANAFDKNDMQDFLKRLKIF